jgi:cobalt-zinc-cadmium efflux system outer membrane protein
LYHVQERTDEVVCDLAAHPFDVAPPPSPGADTPGCPQAGRAAGPSAPATDVQTAVLMQADKPLTERPPVKVPEEIPGTEAELIANIKKLPPEERLAAIRKVYRPLDPLPEEPTPVPGPDGKPYTLADLQTLAAENSPALVQFASDVRAAEGNLLAAWAYPNPVVSYQASPSNDGSTAGVQGFFVSQTIKTGGKLKLSAAAAQRALDNAELALKRARSDLSTQVRNAYFALLVAKESVRVTRAMARLTDEIYLLEENLLEGGFVAPYDPFAFRAQANTARLAYAQAIQTYQYSWMQLVSAVGLRQLPLTEVAGRIDAFIPYYDYDRVKAHVLRNHTDILTARNGIDAAHYNLKLAQITPWAPDVALSVGVQKEFALPPQQVVPSVSVGVPLPIWDQNKGNIMAAEAALVRAKEGPHAAEMNLTTTLATAYMGYKTNLEALEYYRKYILPDLVQTFRGVEERRRFDQTLALADLSTAQQNLATGVTNYLTLLGTLWSSTVGVADLLQTDDLFQLAQPRELPPLPDLEHLPALPCRHPCASPAEGPAPCPAPHAPPGK